MLWTTYKHYENPCQPTGLQQTRGNFFRKHGPRRKQGKNMGSVQPDDKPTMANFYERKNIVRMTDKFKQTLC